MSAENTQTENGTEPRMYTEREVNEQILAAQKRQLIADNERAYGNAFFAESLDHIAGLAKTEQFWKDVYAYGMAFKRNFEIATGQVAPAPAAKAPEKKPQEDADQSNPQ